MGSITVFSPLTGPLAVVTTGKAFAVHENSWHSMVVADLGPQRTTGLSEAVLLSFVDLPPTPGW